MTVIDNVCLAGVERQVSGHQLAQRDALAVESVEHARAFELAREPAAAWIALKGREMKALPTLLTPRYSPEAAPTLFGSVLHDTIGQLDYAFIACR
jgi:hypothetical protein